LGCALGVWLADAGPDAFVAQPDHDQVPSREDASDLPAADDEHEHVGLTRQAVENLQLRTGTITLEDYRQTIRIPGEVIEIPGRSSRSIAAPVTGVVREIYVEAGQVVSPQTLLLEIEVTDEQLIAGQVAMLDLMSQLTVTESELHRLEPLAESGTIAGRRKRELEYERQQLQARLEARVQELTVRGLAPEQVAGVKESRHLMQRIAVRLPCAANNDSSALPLSGRSLQSDAEPDPLQVNTFEHTRMAAEGAAFTVERLSVHPGLSVARGDELCRLADHRWLYIRGEAFEQDIASIAQLNERGWSVTAEFGHLHEEAHGHVSQQEGLDVAYVDNHVDPESRTFHFYLRLRNEVAHEYADSSGVIFWEWRYKPGQLAHLLVPVQQWEQQIRLPRAAIVEEGPNAFVFRLHKEQEQLDDQPKPAPDRGSDVDDHLAEFEPVPVHVLYRDERHAILAVDGPLEPGNEVALNRAYELRLEMKMHAGEGGHHHHHEH
jgi:multidrug efflux pump subunit AcrA (membrane-fusion protein)